MKKQLLTFLGALFALTLGQAQAQTFVPIITKTVGTGANISYVVIDFKNSPATRSYAYAFRYNGSATGGQMLDALQSDGDLIFTSSSFGGDRFVSSFTISGQTKTTPSDFSSYWSYYLSSTSRLSQNTMDWDYAGTGADGNVLTNGSWDGWSWAPGDVSTPPVTPNAAPEPASIGIFALGTGGLVLLICLRRRPAERLS